MTTTKTTPAGVKSWLWIEELAAETGIPVRTFRHWRLAAKKPDAASGGPPSFLIGRRVAYDRGEVQKWVSQRRRSSGVA